MSDGEGSIFDSETLWYCRITYECLLYKEFGILADKGRDWSLIADEGRAAVWKIRNLCNQLEAHISSPAAGGRDNTQAVIKDMTMINTFLNGFADSCNNYYSENKGGWIEEDIRREME